MTEPIKKTDPMPCCPVWEKAQYDGTDNEMYRPLIGYRDGAAWAGSGLPPLALCPWCGALKPVARAGEIAALRKEYAELSEKVCHALEPEEYDAIAKRKERIWEQVRDYV
jgi:hypothetical protein